VTGRADGLRRQRLGPSQTSLSGHCWDPIIALSGLEVSAAPEGVDGQARLTLLRRSKMFAGTAAQTGAQVQEYRAYIVDQKGHITSRIDLLCENVEEARQRAKQLVDGDAIELWQGNQKIERLEPPPRAQP